MPVNTRRIRTLVDKEYKRGPVIYWMSRDQRVRHNWALLFAHELRLKFNAPLEVVFCLAPQFLSASMRQYHFMLQGLRKIEAELMELRVPFLLLEGSPDFEVGRFINESDAGVLVTDFSPLKISKMWKRAIASQIDIPFYEVDAHNIVPCWEASNKQEYAAYTFRPKIHKLVPEFLESFPDLQVREGLQKEIFNRESNIDWEKAEESLNAQRLPSKIAKIQMIESGDEAADDQLRDFVENRLENYGSVQKNRLVDSQSGLSPYLHFGQISSQTIALSLLVSEFGAGTESFLEELIVRKELSDNFCYYNSNYDSILCFPDWSKRSLEIHSLDEREYIYSADDFEMANTHDPLWNAAQMEMMLKGKMNGYMRMYWAKKILEWTETPGDALKIAIYLNDKYELDGRDPNGYVGIVWSIGGVHDRAWKERPILGKIRYMSYKGVSSKFDTQKYISMVQDLV